jgi:hypothetical protein
MIDHVRDIFKRFDEAIASAQSGEAKAHLTAMKLQTELLNLRLGAIEHSLVAVARSAGIAAASAAKR